MIFFFGITKLKFNIKLKFKDDNTNSILGRKLGRINWRFRSSLWNNFPN